VATDLAGTGELRMHGRDRVTHGHVVGKPGLTAFKADPFKGRID